MPKLDESFGNCARLPKFCHRKIWAYAVVVSPDALQSKWVGKELRHALNVQKQRGEDKFGWFVTDIFYCRDGIYPVSTAGELHLVDKPGFP